MTPDPRSDPSRQAILERFPDLSRVLAARPESTAVIAGGRVVDIDIGGTRLYRGDGRELARGQVEAYLANPLRWFRLVLTGDNISPRLGQRLLDETLESCARLGIVVDALPGAPDYPGGVLIVLGVGLGYHLPELIRRTRVRHILLYEPHPEFLGHAAAALDWRALLEEAEAAGCTFEVVTAPDPDQAVLRIRAWLNGRPKPVLDGTWVFAHYPAAAIMRVRDALGPWFDLSYQVFGFFEDECVMFRNTVANLRRGGFRLLEARPVPKRHETVLVVAAGPSLTKDLAEIRRLRPHALILSCGTALRALLAAGIVPDCHCENENAPQSFDIFQETRKAGALSGITLVAALTVEPRSWALFDECWGYFREHVSPTALFARPETVLHESTPNVVNAALRAAVAMGFGSFVLFGVDLGAREPGRLHAEGTVYDHQAFAEWEETINLRDTVPGNFGQPVRTDLNFKHTGVLLEILIRRHRLQVTNCSDGIRIAGTTPHPAATLTLPRTRLDRSRIKRTIAASFTAVQPDTIPWRPATEAARKACRSHFPALLSALRAARAAGADFLAYYQALAPFLDESPQDPIPKLTSGSLLSLYRIGAFFLMRIQDDTTRQALFTRFATTFETLIADMAADCLALLDQALGEEPSATP